MYELSYNSRHMVGSLLVTVKSIIAVVIINYII